ncbi:hypothetical protein PLICRDRAFT_46528 [Plicaturopsis crispa FD-325 SS-3]|uniref:Cytochrome P450 n=1 Tax=Plicaturopsis crispa FD-325 SS-3 TaxID=944288 RepID=A0A0C9SQY6_PLICR|nr:hypothetical protein PLICRDRAFT_46528 [Plicaturopsis crispa FD-325 SS-3]
MPGLTAVDALAGVVGLGLLYVALKEKPRAPLPPGPKGLPVVGNVADMPSSEEWLTFSQWGEKWGGIVSVKLLGQPLIIVNSADVMSELDKKGALHSDRPRLVMAGELVGYAKTLVIMPYGAKFRNFRRYFSKLIGSNAAMKQFLPVEEGEAHKMLRRLLAKPDNLEPILRKTAGGLILMITYGITVREDEDPFVTLIEGANANFSTATAPGSFLVDVLPALKLVPEWVPGAGFKRKAREWYAAMMDMVERPYGYTKEQMSQGTAPVSFVSSLLDEEDKMTPEQIDDIKYTASSLYGAGADTTVSAMYAFFLAMTLFPEVQRKAQAEIDAVVGSDRLPSFADRENLPYTYAVLTEVLRWNSVAPTGVPHRAMEDDIIDGYLVPKGSIIIANLWQMLHDPQVYPEPFKFDPSRHIATPEKPAQRDPRHACFGFGRRICPGMHMAESSVWIVIATALAVFDISKAVVDGVEITPVHENTTGTISFPKPFKCTIKPRSEKAVALINESDEHRD